MSERFPTAVSTIGFVFFLGWVAFFLSLAIPLRADSSPDDYFRIKVVDRETGRGVPLAKLTTTNNRAFWTDSQGNVAIHEPGLMGRDVWFSLESFGYSFQGFLNFPGRKFSLIPGESSVWKINRGMVAERMYRLTGAGIYRDSVLLGEETPINDPLLSSKVTRTGQGYAAVFQDSVRWFWSFGAHQHDKKIGQFNVAGATSSLPRDASVSPLRGVNLSYFQDAEGAPRNLIPLNRVTAVNLRTLLVTTRPDDTQRMFGIFDVGSLQDPSDRGLAKWDPAQAEFQPIESLPVDMKVDLCKHATRIRAQGREWFYLACPLPTVRVPAEPDKLKDLDWYQTFTPRQQGSSEEDQRLDENQDGDVVWGWKSRTDSVTDVEQAQLVDSGLMDRSDGFYHLTDVETGDSVTMFSNSGSVYWNPHRQKWILVATQRRGLSKLGETWYAEGDSPLGPWVYARRIATHAEPNRSFNKEKTFVPVKHHPYFDQKKGKIIYFSGQYSSRFTDSRPTERYTSNEMMYRLDLSDRRLFLPTAVYEHADDQDRLRYGTAQEVSKSVRSAPTIRYYAWPTDRAKGSGVPVWQSTATIDGESVIQLTTSEPEDPLGDGPAFYALSSDTDPGNPAVVGLFEYVNRQTGQLLYSSEGHAPSGNDWSLRRGPIVKVWRSPRIDPPTDPYSEPVQKCVGSSAVCSSGS